jgi:hypothetical protein
MLKLVRLTKQIRLGGMSAGPDVTTSTAYTIDIDWKNRFVVFAVKSGATTFVPFEQVMGFEFDSAPDLPTSPKAAK